MVRENGLQSQVESYQKLKKWYLMPTCLTLSIIRYGTRVKWSNPVNGVAPSSTPRGNFWSPSSTVANFIYLLMLANSCPGICRAPQVHVCMAYGLFIMGSRTVDPYESISHLRLGQSQKKF